MTVENAVIGIRREDKNKWEKRVPLVPSDVEKLVKNHGIKVIVQPSQDHRAFSDSDYESCGAEINEDLTGCDIILGVKEIPKTEFLPSKGYIFFSHVIKGQPYNMPMLQALLDAKCTLIDYEKIENETGQRLIFFGRYAGLAGMVETLHALGKRLDHEGIDNPFSVIKQPRYYASLDELKKCIKAVGEDIRTKGLPDAIKPFVCGFTGYGNVSKGAQEIYDLLGATEIDAETIRNGLDGITNRDLLYKVVFKEEHMFKHADSSQPFDLQHYFQNPQEYVSKFKDFHDKINLLVNCIYWTKECPYLLRREDAVAMYKNGNRPKLKVIGDISCDIEGSVEITLKDTNLDDPMYVFDVDTESAKSGVQGNGPVIMAIENLPCELPVDASNDFSSVLVNFLPALACVDLKTAWESVNFVPAIHGAVIAYQGQLTPEYSYIYDHLKIRSNK